MFWNCASLADMQGPCRALQGSPERLDPAVAGTQASREPVLSVKIFSEDQAPLPVV